jgi:heme exporter protein D
MGQADTGDEGMNWNSVNDFLAMGGYALYVWGSVSMTAALLIGELTVLNQRKKSLVSRHARTARREMHRASERAVHSSAKGRQ